MRPKTGKLKIPACAVCLHRDRGLIEAMMAEGVFLRTLTAEFGISVQTLQRHESLHSTSQPTIDPLSILRMMRWLTEESMFLAETTMHSVVKGKRINTNHRMRVASLEVANRVLSQYAKLTNAEKYMDSHVTLPRWQQVMAKITHAVKDIPGALEALQAAMREEGPSMPPAVATAKVNLAKQATQWDEEKYGPYSEAVEKALVRVQEYSDSVVSEQGEDPETAGEAADRIFKKYLQNAKDGGNASLAARRKQGDKWWPYPDEETFRAAQDALKAWENVHTLNPAPEPHRDEEGNDEQGGGESETGTVS